MTLKRRHELGLKQPIKLKIASIAIAMFLFMLPIAGINLLMLNKAVTVLTYKNTHPFNPIHCVTAKDGHAVCVTLTAHN
jgi:hypothetical protein